MLPKIDVPTYDLKLISQKKPVKFRPFLVKEQKLLLMAQESIGEDGADDTVLKTVKQIIDNCVLSDLKVDELPVFDIEHLFLNLRARSIGEKIKLNFRCVNEIGDVENEEKKKCGNIVEFELNTLQITPKVDKTHSNRIVINEKLGLLMKYPNLEILRDINFDDQDSILSVLISCIEAIYDETDLYYIKDIDKKEFEEFVDSLPTKVVDDIRTFFETMPQIKEEIDFKCTKCGHEEKIIVQGLDSFFV